MSADWSNIPKLPADLPELYAKASPEDKAALDRELIWLEFLDDEAWCRDYLTVQTKQGVLIPGEWGPAQRRLFEGVAKQQLAGKPVRIVYLKARQVFVSTGTAMKFWKETAFVAGQRAQIYAHDDDSAQKIYEYYERFNDHYSGPIPLPRVVRRNRADGIVYDNGSAVEVRTAGSVKGGRSRTTRRLHLSEYAFWPDAEALMTGLLQSIPDDPDTMVVIESTANGMGGAFFDLWTAAVAGDNDFLPLFFGWWEHPEYTRPLDMAPKDMQATLDRDEQDLRVKGVTLEQLSWRRWAIRNKCEGKVERFRQEYPASASEAFQASGRMRIPATVVALHKPVTAERGELKLEVQGTRERCLLVDNPGGALSVWAPPRLNQFYVIGSDVAEGIEASEGLGGNDPDYSVADVFSWPVGVQEAQLRERLTPIELGHYLYVLGRWYNWALIGLEVNGPGASTLQVLLDRGYPAERIARRVVYDGKGTPVGSKYGFKITQLNRDIIVSGYESALGSPGDGGITLRSQISVNELYTFHIVNGKPQAISGRHDDTIFSGGHAVEAMKQAPSVFAQAIRAAQTKGVQKYRQPPARRDPAEEDFWKRQQRRR